jgi:hypothetical protein
VSLWLLPPLSLEVRGRQFLLVRSYRRVLPLQHGVCGHHAATGPWWQMWRQSCVGALTTNVSTSLESGREARLPWFNFCSVPAVLASEDQGGHFLSASIMQDTDAAPRGPSLPVTSADQHTLM